MLGLFPEVQRVEASGTIYIRADGSIEPSDAPISTIDYVTYTLTGNVTSDVDGIVVERDSIIVDGAGYTLQGTVVYPYKGLSLSGRENVTVQNVQIKNFVYGISLNRYGFMGRGSSNNGIGSNNITSNRWGIYLGGGADNNKISGNNIANNSYGVFFDYTTENNTVYGNNIVNNELGICLDGYISATYEECPENNKIYENNIADNVEAGVKLVGLDNIFYHNNFLNNTIVIGSEFSSGGTNDPNLSKSILDDGYPFGGNYWSDYTGIDSNSGSYQNETGSDGIGDAAYSIVANNTDHYPLVGMFQSYDVTYFTPPLVAHSCNVTVISNSTVSNFVAPIWIEHPEVILIEFNVTEEQGTIGFCRVSFPTAMMNGTYHVFVNGTEVPYILLPCSNADYSYLYFTYAHSTEGVIITPEFPSLLILPTFMVVTLLAAIFYRRKHAT
jgi:parallel beta-helix repeat protein